MLTHPTLDKLQALKFTGMATALAEQMAMPDIDELAFEERLGLLVDREATERENRRLTSRLRRAKLKHNAALEDIDYRHPRGLDKSLIHSLATCRWVTEHLNILITGPTGVGKTWIACALAQKACREGYRALYLRLPKLLQELPFRLHKDEIYRAVHNDQRHPNHICLGKCRRGQCLLSGCTLLRNWDRPEFHRTGL